MLPIYERVFTVRDYWDCPRSGTANFHGKPHAFACEFDDQLDEYSNIFRLKPIDTQILELALEQSALGLRWAAAFRRKEVPLGLNPFISRQPPRFMELEEILKSALEVPAEGVARAIGEFRPSGASLDEYQWAVEVLWRPIA
jgi:hypothetical protein